ncbi:hypothetical protein C2G38_2226174 [Gigaspora rosea]|uniref:Uncharacterized protein n=1 Tax=Gigaspora rosea TaxID=44941 RepID=A0A397TYH2_9GLOM|nr:hypothetical protein C2G38_2226174 [Gigaspora rosea]
MVDPDFYHAILYTDDNNVFNVLTLEQSEELQEIINENVILRYIITGNKKYLILEEGYDSENEEYYKWSNARYFNRTEIKKVKLNKKKEESTKKKSKLNGLENFVKMVDTSCEILSNQQNRIRVKNYIIDNNKKKEIVYVEGLEGFKYKNEDEGIKKNRYKTNFDKKVKKFQGTAACSRREVKKPARGTFDEIYEVGYVVEENKDKRVKVEIELLLTYLKSTKCDHTNIIEDLRDYQTNNSGDEMAMDNNNEKREEPIKKKKLVELAKGPVEISSSRRRDFI